MKKFFGAEDAASYAAEIADEWKTEDGDIWDAKTLSGVMKCADEEHSVDEEDGEEYYLVDEQGSLGYTDNDGEEIVWVAMSTRPAAPQQEGPSFCQNCGAKVEADWAFCEQCGAKLN